MSLVGRGVIGNTSVFGADFEGSSPSAPANSTLTAEDLMKLGDRVLHEAYGTGLIEGVETTKSGDTIVLVAWDFPHLSQWPGESPVGSFWTDQADLLPEPETTTTMLSLYPRQAESGGATEL